MFIFVISDILARFFKPVKKFIYLVFGAILRKHEKGEKFVLNGASWVLISAVGTILIFPKIIAISSFSILIISDISAALYGRKYGKHSFLDKSFEGSSAFVLTAIIAIFFIGYMSSAPWTFYFTGIIASFIGAIVEAASIRLQVDDNMSIPLSIGSVLWIGGLIAAYFNNGYLSVL
ncbi:MAG: hypothetical protein NT007_15475 [Candidatus Kapabacteria bacterium]|nr:hypothetical protein [Candidatus Kapabacteria bacterium]